MFALTANDFCPKMHCFSIKLLRLEEKGVNIQEQFNQIAEEYDKNRRKFIPCFDDLC